MDQLLFASICAASGSLVPAMKETNIILDMEPVI